MKKISFLIVMLIFTAYLCYSQNADFNNSLVKSVIPEFTFDNPLTTGTWSTLPISPHAVSRSCCAAIKRGDTVLIYQFGGGATTQLTNVAKYNSKTNAWTNNVSVMPNPISAGWAVAMKGDSLIYVIGGNNATSAYGICMKYNIITNTWTTMAPMTASPCTDQLTAVYHDSLIFCIGGGDGLFGTTTIQYNAARIYNTKTNTWSTATNLPIPMSMSGGGIIGDTIYVFCGASTGGTYVPNCYKGAINPANPSTITWTAIAPYPGGAITRMASFPVRIGNAGGIFCSGGAISGGTLTAATYLYNPCTGSFQTLPNNSQARSNFKGTGLNDSSAYIVAGYTTTGVGTTEKFKFTQIDGSCLGSPVQGYYTDFESYTVGQRLACQDSLNWTTWSIAPCNTTEDPLISSAQSFSPTKSVVITQNNDLVKRFNNDTTGIHEITFKFYVPTGKAGYWNALADFAGSSSKWGMECYLDATAAGRFFGGSSVAVPFAYTQGSWQTTTLLVNLNVDSAKFYMNGTMVHKWRWTAGASGTAVPKKLSAADFFGATATDEFYVDNFSYNPSANWIITGINQVGNTVPVEYALSQNYPNPFNPTTKINFALPKSGLVTMKVYDILGKEVATLVNEVKNAGSYTVDFNASSLTSGVYFYKVSVNGFSEVKKMLLLK